MSDRPTVPQIRARKVRDGAEPLVMVTAYDAPSARIADAGGVDLILVGDSLAMVALGYDDTLTVTIDDMAHHTAAVARAKPGALIVGDLPWIEIGTEIGAGIGRRIDVERQALAEAELKVCRVV